MKLLAALMLSFALLTGCVTGPGGSYQPDYEMIEFGSTLAFTVVINETDVTDQTVLQAYSGLVALQERLLCVGLICPALDTTLIQTMMADAVPTEYQALAVAGSKLMAAKLKRYMSAHGVEIVPPDVSSDMALAIVTGAITAFQPRVNLIKRGLAWHTPSNRDTSMWIIVDRHTPQEKWYRRMDILTFSSFGN
jgi:hypothetical protein